jgi:RNA polymerase sigma factor (sigma-70 family)
MNQDLVPRLFRDEFSKITSVLSKHFSLDHIEIAEDIASETFLLAMETWPYKGVPENPTAWLYTVAKNNAKNFIARTKTFDEKVKTQVLFSLETTQFTDVDLSTENIRDSQLRMLFALCHPSIPAESQIGLCLRILCGFSIDEIATAFLSNKETINKRLLRAKEKLRAGKITLGLPGGHELLDRIQNVLTTLYLLFSEGYYSETNEQIVREPLCEEAIRLTRILLDNPMTNSPEVNALLALMYFHASRLKSRTDANGALILYSDQDPSRWNQKYISLGAYHLKEAAQGTRLSKHHLEAGIAYWHTIKEDTAEKWEAILQLYNRLLQVEYSPIAALNRTYALSKCRSVNEAIAEAEKLKLENNPYYFLLLGELYKNHDKKKARNHFTKAAQFSRSTSEKVQIEKKINEISV